MQRDYNRIYRYNFGATKLALLRAIGVEETAHAWGDMPAIKKAAGGKLLVASAIGIRVDVVKDALKSWLIPS